MPWFHAVQFTFASEVSGDGIVASIHERRLYVALATSKCQVAKSNSIPENMGFCDAASCRVEPVAGRDLEPGRAALTPVAWGLRDAVRGDFVSQMTELRRRPCRGSDSG